MLQWKCYKHRKFYKYWKCCGVVTDSLVHRATCKASYVVSVLTTRLHHCSTKATTDNT